MSATLAPPRTDLVRAFVTEPATVRAAGSSTSPGTLVGHFAVFNTVTVIDNWYEGTFREQIAPGAFTKTFAERAEQIRCIYEHGYDPMFGRKPLGPPEVLREDEVGAWYEVPLFNNQLNREHIVEPASTGQLGASFRFEIIKETFEKEPSDGGLPLRTVLEAKVYEFGPCPFGAYAEASAGMRSGVDPHLWQQLDEGARARLVEMLASARRTSTTEGAGTATPPNEAAPATSEPAQPTRRLTRSDLEARLAEVDAHLQETPK